MGYTLNLPASITRLKTTSFLRPPAISCSMVLPQSASRLTYVECQGADLQVILRVRPPLNCKTRQPFHLTFTSKRRVHPWPKATEPISPVPAALIRLAPRLIQDTI